MSTSLAQSHPLRRSVAAAPAPVAGARFSLGWKAAGLAAVVTSGAALAALPKAQPVARDSDRQWQALAIAPIASGGNTGLRMVAAASVEPADSMPVRENAFVAPSRPDRSAAAPAGPIRVRGTVGDGLYWSLRAAGASSDAAAQYLAAIANQVDVGGDVQPGDRFDLILGAGAGPLLYAGLDRGADRDLQLVRWSQGGRSVWLDAARDETAGPGETGMIMPAAGPVTSTFGHRVHPILRFTRFHAGLDIGASWGSPIVAAGDGQVSGAGWAGGYGRQVRVAHGGGTVTTYSHMSEIAVAPGTFIRRGQVIGYVGSSGFSTGPHLHFEVRQGGVPVNPLSARIVSAPIADPGLAKAVKARLAQLLKVGMKG